MGGRPGQARGIPFSTRGLYKLAAFSADLHETFNNLLDEELKEDFNFHSQHKF
jgi:hypothetical protein